MTPTDPSRTVVVLRPDAGPDPLGPGLEPVGRALGLTLLVPARPRSRPSGPALATWPFVVEEQADALGREVFAVLAGGDAADLGLAVAHVLPHRTAVLGLVAPGAVPPPGEVDAAGLTVPTLVWPGGAAAVWVATVPGARLERGPAGMTRVLRRLLAVADA